MVASSPSVTATAPPLAAVWVRCDGEARPRVCVAGSTPSSIRERCRSSCFEAGKRRRAAAGLVAGAGAGAGAGKKGAGVGVVCWRDFAGAGAAFAAMAGVVVPPGQDACKVSPRIMTSRASADMSKATPSAVITLNVPSPAAPPAAPVLSSAASSRRSTSLSSHATVAPAGRTSNANLRPLPAATTVTAALLAAW